MTIVAVIGAGGPTGLQCVKALLAKGVAVKAVVRSPEKHASAFDKEVQLVQGDVKDAASLQEALKDVTGALCYGRPVLITGVTRRIRCIHALPHRNPTCRRRRRRLRRIRYHLLVCRGGGPPGTHQPAGALPALGVARPLA